MVLEATSKRRLAAPWLSTGDAGWRDKVMGSAGQALMRLRICDGNARSCRAKVLDTQGDWSAICGQRLYPGMEVSVLADVLGDEGQQACLDVLELSRQVSVETRHPIDGRWFQLDVMVLNLAKLEVGVSIQDITRRRERENELYEGKLRYRALADGLPLPIWVLTPDLKTQYVNRFFNRFFGSANTEHSVIWEQLIHEEDHAGFLEALLEATQFRRSCQFQVRGRRNDGSWRWLDVVGTPRHTTTGRFLGLSCSMRDITDQRELELAREQLLDAERAARTEAENNIRTKDEFLAMISHELRTPLTTVVGWSELLLERMDRNDRNYRGMGVIVSGTHALHQLINDMLDLGGMLIGKLQLSMQPLDVGTEIRDAVQSLEAQAGESGVRIKLALPKSRCLIHGDRTRLQQVMWNLLSNSLKFSEQSADRWIRVALDIDSDHCRIHVQDNGVGFAEDFQPHLFTRFRQADSTSTRRYGGMGLGLSIVHNIVEMHGGQVTAYSEGIGQGATFTVTLPLMERVYDSDSSPHCIEERALPQAAGTDSTALTGYRILLVDDQQPILDYLRLALERHGAKVQSTISATESLRLLGGSPDLCCDLVISDIGMPLMDGYALARSIREDLKLDPERLPMIALTALSRPADCERALASGFQYVVAKPCNLSELLAAIGQCFAAVTGQMESRR